MFSVTKGQSSSSYRSVSELTQPKPPKPKYELKPADLVLKALVREVEVWTKLKDSVPRYNTGFNGPKGKEENEVVSEAVLEEIQKSWKEVIGKVLGTEASAYNLRDAYSATEGSKTQKRMHDFLIEKGNTPVFNFHIEVERN